MSVQSNHTTGYIGQRIRRIEDPRLLTGGGQYASDLTFPGMVHLALLRSPHAHARIEHIDTRRATAVPGVLAVFTARDLPEIMTPAPGEMLAPGARHATPTPLATNVVRFVGEPVAVVAAEDGYSAEDGCATIEVDYTPLPVVLSVEQDAATTPILHAGWPSNVAEHVVVAVGEGADALERAHVVVEATLKVGRVSAQPLEPRAAVAVYDETSQVLTVYLATQGVHNARRWLSQTLKLPEERIRVIAPDIGGGFGVKNRQYGEEVLAARLAMRLRRPVRWAGDRREEFISTNQGRAQLHHVRLGLDADARIVALVDHFIQDAGAYNITAGGPPANTARILQGPYRVPNVEYTYDVVLTNLVPTGPYRGAGRPEAAYVMERILDRAAEAIGMDRVEIRRRNLIRPEDMPYDTGVPAQRGTITYETGNYPAGFAQVLAALDYEGFRARQAAERQRGIYLGIGVANSLEMASIGAGESAHVRVDAEGAVTVRLAVVNLGQGLPTACAQIAAERLGVPIARVRVEPADTAALADGIGTFASRSTTAAGNAISKAARQLRLRIVHAAAERMEVGADDLVWEGEQIAVRGAPSTRMAYWDVVKAAGVGFLEEEASAPGPRTFGFQAHGVVLEVDPETLEVRIRDYAICHDGGTIVNPLLADGQTIGSAVQGLGVALSEEMRFDAEGHPLTGALHTYLLPTSMDAPDYRLFEQHFPTATNPEGFKGVGEGGAIPSMPAIAQAIEDALAPFGVRLDEVPITPQRLHDALVRRERGGEA